MAFLTYLARFSWVTIIVGILAIYALETRELMRSGEHAPYHLILLTGLAATGLLAVALALRERSTNRELSKDISLAHQRLQLAMESGKVVAWDWDVSSGRDVWFGDLKTMFGISADVHDGRVEDFRRRVHPDDRELVWRAVAEARQNRTMYQAKFRILWADGTVRWAAASGKFYYADNGEATRMMGIAADITEAQHVEDKLRESQERLIGIVESAMDAIVAVDDEQRIAVFNAAAEKMFGCTAADALGSHVERFVPERFRALYRAYIRRFGVTSGNGWPVPLPSQLWALRKDGEEFPIETSNFLIETGGKKLFTVFIRDVTERNRFEEARRETEGRFQLMADTAPVMLWMSGEDERARDLGQPPR